MLQHNQVNSFIFFDVLLVYQDIIKFFMYFQLPDKDIIEKLPQ